jgi:hypothetical protein
MQSLVAPIVGARAQMGYKGVVGLSGKWGAGLWLAKGNGGFVGRKSLTLGTGLINLSVSVAQLNLCGSYTVALCTV